jgi:hypothetical protein
MPALSVSVAPHNVRIGKAAITDMRDFGLWCDRRVTASVDP